MARARKTTKYFPQQPVCCEEIEEEENEAIVARSLIFAENFGGGEADDEYIPQQPVGCAEIDEEENEAIVQLIKKIGM